MYKMFNVYVLISCILYSHYIQDGNLPVHIAAGHGHAGFVQALVEECHIHPQSKMVMVSPATQRRCIHFLRAHAQEHYSSHRVCLCYQPLSSKQGLYTATVNIPVGFFMMPMSFI